MAEHKPNWLMEIAIESRSAVDRDRLMAALARLAAEDPTFHFSADEESGQTILKGLGELQLGIKIDILKRTHKVEVNVGAPQVAYRETLTKATAVDYTHREKTGGSGQFARVKIEVEPVPQGTGYSFESRIVGGTVPNEYIPGVVKGLHSALGSGPLAGFPVVGVRTTLVDGACHDADSSPLAFEIASRAAFREALQKGGPVLLEPIMKVEVMTPEDYLGSVIGDINARRGQIAGTDSRGSAQVVSAMVPLANMFGYGNDLRSMSEGRASRDMQFDHYERVSSPDDDPHFRPAIGMRA